ncbi:hypothetical protein [Peribacillus frigoritolerans]|uniref:hypothetical protein n=1 Tax=Peribacillus frigoritolerans TaxID=450367 RepID=UPI002E23318D|nr:hypothetical protein [Peribacillus frigoritolerans]MED3844550.1 hypothetical protein [Peribacillus frigoritolerans]
MRKNGLVIFAGICLAVLVFGHLHWKSISQAEGGEAREAAAKVKEKEKEARDALIQSLKPNKRQSLIEYMHYNSLKQDRVIISFLVESNGDSGSSASNFSLGRAVRVEFARRS